MADVFLFRDRFVNVPSQWEMTLQCNVISHWLGTFTKLNPVLLWSQLLLHFLLIAPAFMSCEKDKILLVVIKSAKYCGHLWQMFYVRWWVVSLHINTNTHCQYNKFECKIINTSTLLVLLNGCIWLIPTYIYEALQWCHMSIKASQIGNNFTVCLTTCSS